jgi:hypothetical protein
VTCAFAFAVAERTLAEKFNALRCSDIRRVTLFLPFASDENKALKLAAMLHILSRTLHDALQLV